MSRPRLLAWAGLAAALAGLLALEYQTPATETITLTPAIRRSPAIPASGAPSSAASTQADLALILARPLFQPSRRPPAAAAAAADESLPRLTAVLISQSGKWLIFAPPDGAKPLIVGEGGHVGAYVVQSIAAGQATVSGPRGRLTVRPSFGGAAAAVSAAAPSLLDQFLQNARPDGGIPGLPTGNRAP